MDVASSQSSIKPIPYLHVYQIKEEKDTKRLQRYRLKVRNLFLNEYKIRQNKWVKTRIVFKIKKACFAHLKGLSGLYVPLPLWKIPSILTFHKQICSNLQRITIKVSFSSNDMKRFENHLTRMKHLISFTDLNTTFDQKHSSCLPNVKYLGQAQSLDLPCHVTPKRLDKLQKISVDLEKLEKSGEIPKLPLSLRELSLIDKNPLDKKSHEEVFWKLKDQLNSLRNLKFLSLIFPKKSYYHQNNLFSDLELKSLTITMRSQVDFSEAMVFAMEAYVERTGSEIKIIPSGFSKPEEYLRLLNLLEKRQESNKQGIQLEKVLYPFNSTTGELQREIIEYYHKMSKLTNQVEFMFEFDSENGWFEEQNINNFKEMMEIIEKESSQNFQIIYHFIHKKRAELSKTKEQQIIQAAIDLFKFKGKEITMKVSGDVFGFEMLKSLMPKLFQESSLKIERIYWEHACQYIAGLPEILNDLKAKNKIKDYSLITYQ